MTWERERDERAEAIAALRAKLDRDRRLMPDRELRRRALATPLAAPAPAPTPEPPPKQEGGEP